MTLSARLVLLLNRLFPRVKLRGRAGKDEYSRVSYGFAALDAANWIPLLDRWSGGAVVDVGCGFGGRTVYYAEGRLGPTVGLDLLAINTVQAARFARLQGNDTKGRCLIVQANAERAPLADEQFDAVICSDCMEHFPDPRRTLAEMWRLVRTGGALVLEFSPSWTRTGSHLGDYVWTPWAQWAFSRRTLEEAATEVYRRRRAGILDPEEARRQEEWFGFVMEVHRCYLNEMTLGQFTGWLTELPDALLVRLDQCHTRTKGLALIPWIGGMFAEGITCVVRKVPGRRIGAADIRRARTADFVRWMGNICIGGLRRVRRLLGGSPGTPRPMEASALPPMRRPREGDSYGPGAS
ncbi:MAG: class I SAM-dependent methyltransferase [Planctomycetota bacterium]